MVRQQPDPVFHSIVFKKKGHMKVIGLNGGLVEQQKNTCSSIRRKGAWLEQFALTWDQKQLSIFGSDSSEEMQDISGYFQISLRRKRNKNACWNDSEGTQTALVTTHEALMPSEVKGSGKAGDKGRGNLS